MVLFAELPVTNIPISFPDMVFPSPEAPIILLDAPPVTSIPGPELLIISNAEHFFHGKLVELREAVIGFVA